MISAAMQKDLRVRVSKDASISVDDQGRRTAPDGTVVVGGKMKTTVKKATKQRDTIQPRSQVSTSETKPRQTKKQSKLQPVVQVPKVAIDIQVAGAKFTALYQQVFVGQGLLVLCSKSPVPFLPQKADISTVQPQYRLTYQGSSGIYIYPGLQYVAHNKTHIIMLEVEEHEKDIQLG